MIKLKRTKLLRTNPKCPWNSLQRIPWNRHKVLLLTLFTISLQCYAQDSYMNLVERAVTATQHDSILFAEELYQKALRQDPSNPKNALIYTNLGKIQERLGRNQEALANYDKALEIFPSTTIFLRSRADLYLRIGMYQSAISDYEKIIYKQELNRSKSDSAINALLGYAYTRLMKYDKAKKYIKKALAVESDNYMALLGNTIILQQTGKPQEANTQLESLISQYPDKAEPYALRAENEQKQQFYELALMDISKAIHLDPSNSHYLLTRADIQYQSKQYKSALADYLEAVRLGIPRTAVNDKIQKCRKNIQ